MILPLLLLSTLAQGKSPPFDNCTLTNNHLDPNTKAFVSDCDSFGCMTCFSLVAGLIVSDCSSNGTCLPRRCRREDHASMAVINSPWGTPSLCPEGFCPDDGSGCLSLIPVGGSCELDRDGETENSL